MADWRRGFVTRNWQMCLLWFLLLGEGILLSVLIGSSGMKSWCVYVAHDWGWFFCRLGGNPPGVVAVVTSPKISSFFWLFGRSGLTENHSTLGGCAHHLFWFTPRLYLFAGRFHYSSRWHSGITISRFMMQSRWNKTPPVWHPRGEEWCRGAWRKSGLWLMEDAGLGGADRL